VIRYSTPSLVMNLDSRMLSSILIKSNSSLSSQSITSIGSGGVPLNRISAFGAFGLIGICGRMSGNRGIFSRRGVAAFGWGSGTGVVVGAAASGSASCAVGSYTGLSSISATGELYCEVPL
jgi:hypothetical protein